jgi:hypothetical protein
VEYLKPLAALGAINLDSLLREMRGVKCPDCGAVYLDPWISRSRRNDVFLNGHAVHNTGWRYFLEKYEQNRSPWFGATIEEILDAAESIIGPVRRYAEIGCPFQGLLISNATSEILQSWTSIRGQRRASMRPETYERFLTPAKISLRLAVLSNRIALTVSSLRRLRNKLRGRHEPDKIDARLLNLTTRDLVPVQSSSFWGMNCALLGNSCISTASTALGVNVVTYEQFSEFTEPGHYDLIGIFNVLDHVDNPLKLLRTCLTSARAVICFGHDTTLGKQHRFGLTREFFEQLPRTIDSCKVQAIGNTEGPNLLYLVWENNKMEDLT